MEEQLKQMQEWYPKRRFVIDGGSILEQRHCPDCGQEWLARDLGEGLGGSIQSCPTCIAARRAEYEAGDAERVNNHRRQIEADVARERWCD